MTKPRIVAGFPYRIPFRFFCWSTVVNYFGYHIVKMKKPCRAGFVT